VQAAAKRSRNPTERFVANGKRIVVGLRAAADSPTWAH
jgi:hypothetical protein